MLPTLKKKKSLRSASIENNSTKETKQDIDSQ